MTIPVHLLVAAALAASGAPAAPASAPGALRDEATRELRAGRTERACDLFRRAADAAPADGAIQADLGLCLGKLGKRDEAIAAARRAIALGDERTRRNAYHNLRREGVAIPVPAPGACTVLRDPQCGEVLHACAYDWQVVGNRGGGQGVLVRIAPDEATARVPAATAAHLGGTDAFTLEGAPGAGPTLDLLVRTRFAAYCGEPYAPGGPADRAPRCDPDEMRVTCAVVDADPCSGRIGLDCERVEAGKRSVRAAEYVLRRAR